MKSQASRFAKSLCPVKEGKKEVITLEDRGANELAERQLFPLPESVYDALLVPELGAAKVWCHKYTSARGMSRPRTGMRCKMVGR